MNRFSKYQALGNDMIVIDPTFFKQPLTPLTIRMLCRRHFGIGADGICHGPILGENAPPFSMRFFNPDGSESEKSGNGMRIFARYLRDKDYVSEDSFHIHMSGEPIQVRMLDNDGRRLALSMGRLSFNSEDVHLTGDAREVVDEELTLDDEQFQITAVSVGNPHCIIFTENLSQIHSVGPRLESAPQFRQRTNVQLVRVIDEQTITIEIWERGAGYTLASGTSSTATAAAAVRHGFCQSPVTVIMNGGIAEVIIDQAWCATLIGEAVPVYEGILSSELANMIRAAERIQ
ncbi:MAG: diaminopimelate epimerase [Candidatus Promineifilaceae bacterium]|nr:diaminopimelate epimerase [Candidatus Promineifilaceae bacterium]